MPKRKLQSYNRYLPPTTDLLDVAWHAAREGALEWDEVQHIQDSLIPDCAACGAEHGGRYLIEKVGYCQACFRVEIAKRMAGKR